MYIYIFVYLLFTIGGLILMKLSNEPPQITFVKQKIIITIAPFMVLGLIAYIISFLLWMRLVTYYELSYIMPVTAGLVQVASFVAAIMIFSEKPDIFRIIGIILIIIGVVVINIKFPR